MLVLSQYDAAIRYMWATACLIHAITTVLRIKIVVYYYSQCRIILDILPKKPPG